MDNNFEMLNKSEVVENNTVDERVNVFDIIDRDPGFRLNNLKENGLLRDDEIDTITRETRNVLLQTQDLYTGEFKTTALYKLDNFKTVEEYSVEQEFYLSPNNITPLIDDNTVAKTVLFNVKSTTKVNKKLSVAGKRVITLDDKIDLDYIHSVKIRDGLWAVPEFYSTGYNLNEDESDVKEMFSDIFKIDFDALEDADFSRMFDAVDHVLDYGRHFRVEFQADHLIKYDIVEIR